LTTCQMTATNTQCSTSRLRRVFDAEGLVEPLKRPQIIWCYLVAKSLAEVFWLSERVILATSKAGPEPLSRDATCRPAMLRGPVPSLSVSARSAKTASTAAAESVPPRHEVAAATGIAGATEATIKSVHRRCWIV
jgi:hypothetical protein